MTLADVTGLALLHFVWQGTAIALLAAAALRLARGQTPNARYAIACTALAVMVAAPVVTGLALVHRPATIALMAAHPSNARPATDEPRSRFSNQPDLTESPNVPFARLHGGRPLGMIAWLWMAGVMVLSTRISGGWMRVHRLHRLALAAPPSVWQRVADRMAARLKIHIVDSIIVGTPVAIGWMRPVILLPAAALANLTPAQTEAILAHEIAHIRRHDYLVNLLQTMAETLLFYHPGVWWVSARIRAEREQCCDDAAVAACGEPQAYVDALIELEALRFNRGVLAPAATSGPLAARVRRILRIPDERLPRTASTTLTIVLACAIAFGGAVLAERSSLSDEAAQPAFAGPWNVRATEHAEIHFRPRDAARVDEIAKAVEAAYAQLTADMRHELASKVPMIVVTTDELDSVLPSGATFWPISRGPAPGPVLDTTSQRMLVPVDRLQTQPRLVAHELTHMFMFDILPPLRIEIPSWLPEGLAEHVAGVWTPADMLSVREAIASGGISSVSRLAGSPIDERTRHIGHAAVDFIDQEFGKAGIRRFLLALRQGVQTAGSNAYETAFGLTPEEFDREFTRYVQARFVP